MSQNNNSGDGSSGGPPAKAPWGSRAGYIGTGILIGLVIYPFVRKALSKVQPKMDKLFDDLTGKAEHFAEKASDIMARAKENLGDRGDHGHSHDHDEPGKGPLQ